jgi:hypothetical protein
MRARGCLVWVMLVAGRGLVSLQAEGNSRIVVRGRVMCRDAAGTRGRSCSPGRVGIRRADSHLDAFRPADPATAILADLRLRDREFHIPVLHHEDDRLESMSVRVIREGQIYDVSHVREVCRITSPVSGVCPWCHREVTLEETPVSS